jgi:peptide-methionine (S)-S-oxide reductase
MVAMTTHSAIFLALAGTLMCSPGLALAGEPMNPSNSTARTETATFSGGCFWCIEAVLQQVKGVKSVVSGYTGGHAKSPTYEDVCSGRTGHAEAVQVEFDPAIVSYGDLLDVFWQAHDPTQMNRQGHDVGTQYRSAIFYHGEEQRKIAEASKQAFDASGQYPGKLVTSIEPAGEFYKAEPYHQNYYRENPNAPYCLLVIRPKLKKLGMR